MLHDLRLPDNLLQAITAQTMTLTPESLPKSTRPNGAARERRTLTQNDSKTWSKRELETAIDIGRALLPI